MALIFKINNLILPRCMPPLNCKNFKVEFRGQVLYSTIIYEMGHHINQEFKWKVDPPLQPSERLSVQLRACGKMGNARVVGEYSLRLHKLVAERKVSLTEPLVDIDNRNLLIYIEMEALYIHSVIDVDPLWRQGYRNKIHRRQLPAVPTMHAPGPSTSRRNPSNEPIAGSSQSQDIDQNPLGALERHIKAIERPMNVKPETLNIERIEPGDETRTHKLKVAGKRVQRRESPETQNKHTEQACKTERNLMPQAQRTQCRSGRREELALLPVAGPSTAPDQPCETSISSDETLAETRSYPNKPQMKRKTSILPGLSALTAAFFQVCVAIIEARQPASPDMDSVVCVQIGEARQFTCVKESTDRPYNNTYFVFDFLKPPILILEKMITISLLKKSRHGLRANELLGSFKLRVESVWNQPNCEIYHQWVPLTDPENLRGAPKGYLKCDICILHHPQGRHHLSTPPRAR